MEDENGLELSLGLFCGGSSIKSKGKITSSSGGNAEENDRGNKLVDDFKNFLHGENHRQDSDTGSFQSNLIPSKENFFNDLSKVGVDGESSIDLKRKGTWIESSNQYAETDDDILPEVGKKHKLLFKEMNNQKKLEKESHHSDLHEKARASHISTTEDGSTAENEDVVESGTEGSSSRLASKHDDVSKRYAGATSLPLVSQEISGFADSSAVDLTGLKRYNNSSIGAPISIQTTNMRNVPYPLSVKDSNTLGAGSTSGHLHLGMQHVLSAANGERLGAEHVNARNLPLISSLSPLQMSAMDKDKSWGLVSHPQTVHHPSVGGGSTSSAATQVIGHFSSEGLLYNGRTEHIKGDSKQPAVEEGSSSRAEYVKGGSSNHIAKDASERSKAAGVSLDFPAIRPGIAADVEFGGCGSYPNLPWVSTTGPGPTGKTISGVTYRYSANQVKIVCACHGSHMLPDEFIRHASDENFNAQNGNGSTTSKNPAAST